MRKNKNFSVFFVGIGGISMSALALYLHNLGFKVSGYDKVESTVTNNLKRYGISINTKGDLEGCDIAVLSSAISESDDLVKKLKQLNKTCILRSELLNEIANTFQYKVGVAGTHGKTTTTAMIAHVLKKANKNFSAHIGGIDKDFGNMACFGKEIFLSEVCEYKKNISKFDCDLALLLNADDDHLESYGKLSELHKEFSAFLMRSKINVLPYEQKELGNKNSITFSLKNSNADFFASNIRIGDKNIECTVNSAIGALFDVKINSLLEHDVENAIASVAVCKALKIENEYIKKGLEDFNGIKRRNEIMATIYGCDIYADYAHHPKQIEATVEMLAKKYKKFAILFQSHTYSRTATLFKGFIKSLSAVENLFIFDTYAAREKYYYNGSGKRLFENLKGAVYLGDRVNAKSLFPNACKKFDCIAVIGAGDLYDVIEECIAVNNY
ncbi:MAG: hypothetical protein IJA15_02520 [Clostridia bacterium]|nr:hypothetical protein [Clostridia bacterium]